MGGAMWVGVRLSVWLPPFLLHSPGLPALPPALGDVFSDTCYVIWLGRLWELRSVPRQAVPLCALSLLGTCFSISAPTPTA